MTLELDSHAEVTPTPVVAECDDRPDEESPRLPVWPTVGLLASGAFAFWESLTCFVCSQSTQN